MTDGDGLDAPSWANTSSRMVMTSSWASSAWALWCGLSSLLTRGLAGCGPGEFRRCPVLRLGLAGVAWRGAAPRGGLPGSAVSGPLRCAGPSIGRMAAMATLWHGRAAARRRGLARLAFPAGGLHSALVAAQQLWLLCPVWAAHCFGAACGLHSALVAAQQSRLLLVGQWKTDHVAAPGV